MLRRTTQRPRRPICPRNPHDLVGEGHRHPNGNGILEQAGESPLVRAAAAVPQLVGLGQDLSGAFDR